MAEFEKLLHQQGFLRIAGVDEAGRGACAGPLVVAAAVLPTEHPKLNLCADSKSLSEKDREARFEVIKDLALAFSIVEISSVEIDQFGLHECNLTGMRRAVAALEIVPDFILTDGYAIEGLTTAHLAMWKGDAVSLSIGAASILAKVHRDRIMRELAIAFPQYGFEEHKGYATARHTASLQSFGITPVHRKSFANIAALST